MKQSHSRISNKSPIGNYTNDIDIDKLKKNCLNQIDSTWTLTDQIF